MTQGPADTPKICACGKTLGRANASGKCRPCFARGLAHDGEAQELRLANLRAKFDDPAYRAEHVARLHANASTPRAIESRRVRGREQAIIVLHSPAVRAIAHSPEVRRRAGISTTNTRLAWCPVDRRAEYQHLIRSKRLTAAEARRIIEAEIANTAEAGRREVANYQLRARLKHEREKAQAY